MPTLKNKVFAYIVHNNRLLLFRQPLSPEAGIQVPAGTLEDNETPEHGVLREAVEETGLTHLQIVEFLGVCDHPVPERDQIHRRHFFFLTCIGNVPECWQHNESAGENVADPIPFDFFWAEFPNGLPLLAPGHGKMLQELQSAISHSSNF